MKKYYIKVKETLERIITVEARSFEEAYERVEEWANEEDGLEYEDLVSRDLEDYTAFCETRDYKIQNDFFEIPRKFEPLEIIENINTQLRWMYYEAPTMSYDEAFESIRHYPQTIKEGKGLYYLGYVSSYTYPNGRQYPILILREEGREESLGYVAVNKHNKIQAVQNMLEVK